MGVVQASDEDIRLGVSSALLALLEGQGSERDFAATAEYVPTEQELVMELCNARGCNWRLASMMSGVDASWNGNAVGPYWPFMRGMDNFPEIPLFHMLTPNEWREKPLAFILRQIRSSPTVYRNIVVYSVDRYRIAARKRLTGIAQGKWIDADELDKSAPMKRQALEERYFRLLNAESLHRSDIATDFDAEQECYRFHPDTVEHIAPLLTTADLIRKVLALQTLQQLLDEAVENRVETKPATAFTTSTPGGREATAERPENQKRKIPDFKKNRSWTQFVQNKAILDEFRQICHEEGCTNKKQLVDEFWLLHGKELDGKKSGLYGACCNNEKANKFLEQTISEHKMAK